MRSVVRFASAISPRQGLQARKATYSVVNHLKQNNENLWLAGVSSVVA